MRLAVIPARGGSKRVPGKNIRPFAGRPMIHWPIMAARDSGLFDAVIVSTDDDDVARVAREAGAETPFRRPPEMADDHTPLRPVIIHAVGAAEAHYKREVDAVCCLLATAAFVTPPDLQEGLAALENPQVDFAFAAAAFPAPVQRGFKQLSTGGVQMLHPEHRLTRSQDLEACFYDVGQFYWGKRAPYLAGDPIYGPRARMIQIPELRARDIDTPEDWTTAEALWTLFHDASGDTRQR